MKTKLHSIIYYLLSALLTVFTTGNSTAQIYYWQGFNTMAFPPAQWTMTTVTGNPIWSSQANGNNPACTPLEGARMARFFSDQSPAGNTQTLITPVIDYSAITANDTARIRLWVFRDTTVGTIGDSLTILVNTTNSLAGATRIGGVARSVQISLPNTVTANGWYRYTFDVPGTFNTNTNYLMIQGTSQQGNNIFGRITER